MEKAMATHSSSLAWKIPWMEEPGRAEVGTWWDQRSEWGRWKGCLCFLSLPGQELLTGGIWRAQGACGLPEVMHKMHLCTSFCSDKSKCPGFTPSEYFIFVPSLYRSCALTHPLPLGSHLYCFPFCDLVYALFSVRILFWRIAFLLIQGYLLTEYFPEDHIPFIIAPSVK